MRVLAACEYSGVVREAFAALGHDAWSCDLEPTEIPSDKHYQGNVREILSDNWDLVLAFPPCTYLSVVGNRWKERNEQAGLVQEAREFFLIFDNLEHVPQVCIENPVGVMNSSWRKPDQIIYPYQFGEPWSKRTCLWLKGLPLLQQTERVVNHRPWVTRVRGLEGAYAAHKKAGKQMYWDQIAKTRSRTFPGIAKAMAEQWGTV